MKKGLISVFVLIIIAGAIYILSSDFPPVDEKESSGTIGKAEKFRGDEISASDIKLRSGILNDKENINRIIAELIKISIVMAQTSDIISNGWLQEVKAIDEDLHGTIATKLNSVTESIKNGRIDISEAIDIVDDIKRGNIDQSIDAEKYLADVSASIIRIHRRTEVIKEIVNDIDKKIATKEISNPAKIESLKKLRDHILINTIQYAIAMGDKDKVDYAAEKDIYSTENVADIYKGFEITDNIGVACGKEKIALVYAKDGLNAVVFSREELNFAPVNAKDDLNFTPDKERLGVLSKEQLGAVYFNNEQLNTFMSDEKLKGYAKENSIGLWYTGKEDLNVYSHESLNSVLSKETLNLVNSHIMNSKENLNLQEAKEQLGKHSKDEIGAIFVFDKEKLNAWAKQNLGCYHNMERLGMFSMESLNLGMDSH